MNYSNEFYHLYQQLDLTCAPLSIKCDKADECWRGLEKSDYEISIPWKGEYYDSTRMLNLAINMNGFGGLDAYQCVVKRSKEDFKNGKKLTCSNENSNEKYRGNLLHHRMTSFSVAFLDALRPINWTRWGRSCEMPKSSLLIESYEYFAHTNIVKCSYNNDEKRAKPSPKMLSNCPNKILIHEFSILKPTIVLLFGIDIWAICESPKIIFETTYFDHFTGKLKNSINSQIINWFDFYHPSQGKGSKNIVYNELYDYLANNTLF